MQMKRRGVEMRMVLPGDSTPNRLDLPLLKAVARARRWADELVSTLEMIASTEWHLYFLLESMR